MTNIIIIAIIFAIVLFIAYRIDGDKVHTVDNNKIDTLLDEHNKWVMEQTVRNKLELERELERIDIETLDKLRSLEDANTKQR